MFTTDFIESCLQDLFSQGDMIFDGCNDFPFDDEDIGNIAYEVSDNVRGSDLYEQIESLIIENAGRVLQLRGE